MKSAAAQRIPGTPYGFLAPAELVLAALCLWAAWYHTPAGALVRTAGAWFFKTRSTALPLLAYYGAGVYQPRTAPPPMLAAPVPPAQALGYGAWAVFSEENRQRESPVAISAQIKSISSRLSGSDEAAMLALFCGEESARFALGQAGAEARLDELARELPPRSADCVAQASQALMQAGAYALAWPLPESVRITSSFGIREDPVLGVRRLHAGVDLGTPVGTPVRAVAAGVVRRASSDGVNGSIVVLDHGRGVVTLYCHNDDLLVHDGQRVERGQVISHSGNTGRSTGPHLHYQLDLAGEAVDPLRYRAGHPKTVAAGASD
jgi:murein DD-endopeptidase MepM/ murein hydrolase activator NlpD